LTPRPEFFFGKEVMDALEEAAAEQDGPGKRGPPARTERTGRM